MENPTNSQKRTFRWVVVTAACAALVGVLLVAVTSRMLRARHAAWIRHVAGVYEFKRERDGVINTADFRTNGICYFSVSFPGSNYTTSTGDISAGAGKPGLPSNWDIQNRNGDIEIKTESGDRFTLSEQSLIHPDGSKYMRTQPHAVPAKP